MRILIDGATWTNVRGYGRFTREVVKAMLALAPQGSRFALLVDPATRKRDDLPHSLELVEVPVDVPPGEAASASGARSLRDLLRFRRAAARAAADVLFFPAVYSYFPVAGRVPVAVTFHDTIAESLPRHIFPHWHNRFFWNLKCRFAARRANLVVTISEASRRSLEAAYPISGKPVVVVPEGSDPEVFHARRSAAEESRERQALGLRPGTSIILAVGGLSPHKNLDRLILAVAALVRENPGRDLHLVLVGADRGEDVFFSSREQLLGIVREEKLEGRVTFTGFVPDARLGALYRAASVLAFPSLLEGFGLPALEAMACGTPVVASRRGALPEILEGAGTLFDATSTDDLARALALVLDDRGHRDRAAAAGLSIAERFSWSAAAEKLLAEFEKIVTAGK